MSTIAITFETQRLDFQPQVPGKLTIMYNDGAQIVPLVLNVTTGVSTNGFFSAVPFDEATNGSESDDDQAIQYAQAFNRDFKLVGGDGRVNLRATVVDNVVTITALEGTFEVTSTYTGNILIVGIGSPDNTTQTDALELSVTRSIAGGGCDNIVHGASATGGQGPYTLFSDGVLVTTNWNGSSISFYLIRGGRNFRTISVQDSVGETVSQQIYIPRNLRSGEITLEVLQGELTSDITVSTVEIEGITPLSYSIEPQGATEGLSYQSSPVFLGVFPGTYEVFVRDVYGCATSSTVIISDLQDTTDLNKENYFKVALGNSVLGAECQRFDALNKPNFLNTLSSSEVANVVTTIEQSFDKADFIPIQFKSSYPFHKITKHGEDGSKTDISPILIQENLGARERVDCKTFPYNNKTAIYFDGGNQYIPDTTTVFGPSEYVSFSPEWAIEGQIVTIVGQGAFVVDSTGYDSDLQRSFMVIDLETTEEADEIIQVTYNSQKYNLFEAYFFMTEGERARIIIEKGIDEDNIVGNSWVSEILKCEPDTKERLLIRWSDTKNRGDIVFQSGVVFMKRIVGEFRPLPTGTAEVSPGDTRVFSLLQTTRMQYRMRLEGLSSKDVYQLTIASGVSGFEVNNLPLVRMEYPSIEEIGGTNLYSMELTLGYGGDDLGIVQDEIVLNSSTGVTGGGSGVDDTDLIPPVFDGRTRLTMNGGFVTVDGNYIAI